VSTHSHKVTVAGKTATTTTATVPDPDLSPYALKSDFAALTARVAKLEAATPPPVQPPVTGRTVTVTSVAALLAQLADDSVGEVVVADGTYTVPNASASAGLWIDSRFASRTNPVLVRAQTVGGVTLSGGGATGWNPLCFRDGAHHQTWQGFHFASGDPTQTGVIVFGQNGSVTPAPPHHITLLDITVDESVTSTNAPGVSGDHAVYFSSTTTPAHDILIDRLTVNAATSGLDSALHFYVQPALGVGPQNVTVRHMAVTGTDQAVILWDGSLAGISIEDSTITGAKTTAVRYEVGGTVALHRVTSTGSGAHGFYSSLGPTPPGVTFDSCSLG
jgi:hypothetical protein